MSFSIKTPILSALLAIAVAPACTGGADASDGGAAAGVDAGTDDAGVASDNDGGAGAGEDGGLDADGGALADMDGGEATTADAGGCGATHEKVGYEAELITRFHGVVGTVRVVDDCTLEIEHFTYDGAGLDVRVYGSPTDDFTVGSPLTGNLVGSVFDDETLVIPLPEGASLDDIEFISVWCVDVPVSFADGQLQG